MLKLAGYGTNKALEALGVAGSDNLQAGPCGEQRGSSAPLAECGKTWAQFGRAGDERGP